MRILAVDPGTVQSAIVGWDGLRVTVHGILPNDSIIKNIREDALQGDMLVIERVESFGMAVGRETFRTVFWCGRFAEAWEQAGGSWAEVSRKDVKSHLCGTTRATDSNIRQALIDRFGPIGTKKEPGPVLYGLKGHEFAALGVAVTYYDKRFGDDNAPDITVGF
jgi:hypothetical protein